ncbi:MAG: Rap1a/Tai family immunity protein [Candidatus Omnitrophota bacterium]
MKKSIVVMSLTILLVMTCCASQFVFAESSEEYTGMDLFKAAASVIKQSQGVEIPAEESVLMLYWSGYVVGFDDASVVTHAGGRNKFFNLPANGANTLQVMTIVHKYLSDNPEMLNESARVCLLTALGKAFPAER